MGSNLAKAISHVDTTKIATAFFKPNRKTGARTATVIANGVMQSKTITKTGVQIFIKVVVPAAAIKTTSAKKVIANDLRKNGLPQYNIASLLGTSPATISRWLHK